LSYIPFNKASQSRQQNDLNVNNNHILSNDQRNLLNHIRLHGNNDLRMFFRNLEYKNNATGTFTTGFDYPLGYFGKNKIKNVNLANQKPQK